MFVSEPYQLFGHELVELAALVAAGWSVTVHGTSAHCPGGTIVVLLQAPAREAAA